MRAVTYDQFGPVDVLYVGDVTVEPPGAHDIQVEPVAVSVNPIDGKIRRGELTLMSGKHFPKRTGQDFSGVVRAVGSKVERWKVGDEVYGCCRGMKDGALGDLVNVPEDSVAARPTSISHAEAAALPMVALAAEQALKRVAAVGAGTSLLVNGCTGGFGLMALQLGRIAGATTTGVCSTAAVGVATEYGAAHVIDYRAQQVTDLPGRYDAILELSGKLPFAQASRLLTDHGVYVDVSPSPATIVGSTLANPVRHHKHKVLMSKAHTADLAAIAAMIDDGSLRPLPVRILPFDEFAAAYRLAEAGNLIGKVVIQVRDE